MAKRTATSDINRDNWDDEDEPEEQGNYNQASQDELNRRVIKKAKRRTLNSDQESSGAFAGFTGFAASNLAKPNFDFLTTSKTPVNGSLNTAVTTAETTLPTSFPSSASEIPPSAVPPPSEPSTVGSSQPGKKLNRSPEYFRKLKALNDCVLSWITLHVKQNPYCILLPVFDDYGKFFDELNASYPQENSEIDSVAAGDKTKFSSFDQPQTFNQGDASFGSKLNSTSASFAPVFSSSTTTGSFATSAGSFSFSNNSTKTPAATSQSAASNTSIFSFKSGSDLFNKQRETSSGSIQLPNNAFGSSLSPMGSSKSGFSFGDFDKKPSTSSFEVPKPNLDNPTNGSLKFAVSSLSSDVKEENQNEEEEEEETQKPEIITPVVEEKAFFSMRCKLFYKKGEIYIERGLGMLHLKSVEQKTQLVIRAHTNLGNILLNIILNQDIKTQLTGKNNILLMCVPNPPMESVPDSAALPIPMLIRVKTPEDAAELLKQIDDHKF